MQDADLAFTPIWQLRELLDSRQVSPVELTELYLRRIEALNPKLNAFLTVAADEALSSARSAEQKISQGQVSGSLLGIPISIKDTEATKGIRTTIGSLVFQDDVPDKDSANVARIRAAGAILLGKTNTPEFGMSLATENRLMDPCYNPWDTKCTSGGSSGGASAAVAAAMCSIASGTDAGGSIRMPASFCGVYGFKPTLGRVPRYTVWESGRPVPNLTSAPGPITRTVKDAAILLQVMAGHDSGDPISLRETPPDFVASLDGEVRGLRLAWSPDLGYASVESEVAAITAKAAHVFEELGCVLDQPAFGLDNPISAHLVIIYASAYASLGHLLEERAADLTDYGRQTLEQGQSVTGADFAVALRTLYVMRAQLDDLFESYDLLLTPTMPMPAFPLDNRPKSYTNPAAPFSFGGHPAASIPCGFTDRGLPVGLQIVGRRGDEATVLRASAAFEQARPWAERRPPVS